MAGPSEYNEATIPIECIVDVGESLPELAEELFKAQAIHGDQLYEREDTLKILQETISNETEKQAKLKHDIYNCNKSLCLVQEDSSQRALTCGEVEKVISQLIVENLSLEQTIEETQTVLVNDQTKYRRYHEMMLKYKEASELMEESLPIKKELGDTCKKLKEIQKQRSLYISEDGLQLLSGEKEEDIEKKISIVKSKKGELEREIICLQNELTTVNDTVTQLKSNLVICRKRKQAHMTRLHHQLQEAQSRHKQWTEERERLKMAVKKLKRKIEE